MQKLLEQNSETRLNTLASCLVNMEDIRFIPVVYAGDFSEEIEDELLEYDISTHYQSDILVIDWKFEDYFPKLKKWLLETYGEEIKKYEQIGIEAT